MDLLTGFALGALATFLPLYVGLYIPRLFASAPDAAPVFMAPLSAGIMFWFFIDVMGDAAQLDVNQGFTGNYTHAVLAALFAFSLLLLFWLERRSKSSAGGFSFAVAGVAALGIGFHAFGEGLDIGSVIPTSPSLIDAIGGVLPGTAYVLHKLLEGFVIGVFALLARSTSNLKLALLGLIGGVPTIIGVFAGLPAMIESTYFFAMGGAAVLYVEFKLIPTFATTSYRVGSVIALLVGFYLMYFAGLFHS